MRPRAIIWRRCPASAALKEILSALLSSLTPDTAAKALASRFNRAPHIAARQVIRHFRSFSGGRHGSAALFAQEELGQLVRRLLEQSAPGRARRPLRLPFNFAGS